MRKDKQDFSYDWDARPDYSMVTVRIPAGETLRVEASAMAGMDTNVKMKTKLGGGLGRLVTGESIFINEFSADGGDGDICIAPPALGDMEHIYLEEDSVILQNSAFTASGIGVDVQAKWQGLVSGFFSGEGLFLIRCSGRGDLWFSTYGAMTEIDVDGEYVVDTGNVVAFTEGLDYRVSSVGGYKSLFFSGEGLVCRFSGRGKLWTQTRKVSALGKWIYPYRPKKKKND